MATGYEKEVKAFLGPRGPLAELLPNYEHRPEQAEMAAAALRALAGDRLLVVEAGTGTGKTLAYLVPAIYSSRKVVISTGTKALQEQLINKDLPVLTKEFKVTAAVMKGRTNYLCWRRYHEFSSAPAFDMRDEISVWDRIQEWARTTKSGDRAEVPHMPDQYSAWREMSSSSEQCLGQKCSHFEQCFVTKMRAMAQAADIVVVNHHLFFADLAVKSGGHGQVLPAYETVIFDEAHGLAEIATEYFGPQVSTWRILDLGRDLRRIQRLGQLPVPVLRVILGALEKAEGSAIDALKFLAEEGASAAGGESSRFSIGRMKGDPAVVEEGERAVGELRLLAKTLSDHKGELEVLENLADRANGLARDLAFILAMDDPDHVYWAETRGRGVILRASPAELGPILSELLFSEDFPIVFTSATLAVRSNKRWSFSHFSSELGLADSGRKVDELCLPSSYDWKDRAILYTPEDLPEPGSAGFIKAAAREMLGIVRISKGRAFLLFTSPEHGGRP